MTPKASIIILTYNNLDYTRQCLESIIEKTTLPDYEVIVVDNASHDGTPAYLQDLSQELSNFKILLNPANEGFARGNNIGAASASGVYLVFVNNDTVITAGCLEALLDKLEDPSVGMVGPVTNSSANETRIEVSYQGLDGMEEFAREYTQAHAGQVFEIAMLPFQCVGMRREVFDEVGPLDERFGTGMFEDDDYALRVRRLGYRILCAEDAFIHHYGSASFSRLAQADYWRLFKANLEKFEEKWGVRWKPHTLRPEHLPEQLRMMVDDAIWRTEQLDQLQAYVDDLHSSRAWRLVQGLWKMRLRLLPTGSLRSRLAEKLWKAGNPIARGAGRLKDKSRRPAISWQAYSFIRYRKAREADHPANLSSLRTASIPGLVSVVLPVYNGAKYLPEALESILSQTYQNFELIVVDDGSTDDTPEILKAYTARERRMRVVSQPNQRLPRALNAGFGKARGEFLTWTSADNRLKPDFLSRMVDSLERHPDWDMVYANLDLIDERGRPLRGSAWYQGYQNPPGSEHVFLPKDPAELNVIPNNYVGAAFLYRARTDFLIGEYDPHRFGTEDYDYWMRINALLRLNHADFDDPVYEYRFHSKSLTSRDQELGITRNRDSLMVYEDARRDFYQAPLAWLVEAGESTTTQVIYDELRELALHAGHIWLQARDPALLHKHRLWYPLAAVKVSDRVEGVRPDSSWPGEALKVLLVSPEALQGGEAGLSRAADTGWDLCLAAAGGAALPLLDRQRQGWASSVDMQTLFSAMDIRARSKALQCLSESIANPPPPACKLSVVICTYRRGRQLADALESTARQTFAQEEYEVIVVNNDPSDKMPSSIVEQLRSTAFSGRSDRLRLVVCPFKGLSYARNAGISEARGEVVCFLDDDAQAFPDWLEQIWDACRLHPNAGVIGGTILLKPPREGLRWLKPGWEHFWTHFTPEYERPTAVTRWWEFPWGANWCASRQALLRIGGFRGRYGRSGENFSGGEEVIAASLIQRLGYQVVVAPQAKVYHLPGIHRYSLKHVRQTIFSSKLGEYGQQRDLYMPALPDENIFKQQRRTFFAEMVANPRLKLYQRLACALNWMAAGRVLAEMRKDRKAREALARRWEQAGESG